MTKIKNTVLSIENTKSKSSKTALSVLLLVATGLAGASVANAQQPQQAQRQQQGQEDVQQRLQRLQTQLQSLNADIQAVQAEANQDPKVRKALKKYSAELTEQMKAIDPEKSDLIDERDKVYDKLLKITANQGEMSEEETRELQALGERFNAIRQELSMVEAQANQTDVVQEAFQDYNETILAEMNRIDPETSQKIEQQQKLSEEFSNLRNAIYQQQQ